MAAEVVTVVGRDWAERLTRVNAALAREEEHLAALRRHWPEPTPAPSAGAPTGRARSWWLPAVAVVVLLLALGPVGLVLGGVFLIYLYVTWRGQPAPAPAGQPGAPQPGALAAPYTAPLAVPPAARRPYGWLVVGVLLLLAAAVPHTLSSLGPTVSFADARLEQAIRQELGLSPADRLTERRLWELDYLQAAGAGITSLQGIEQLHVWGLDLSGNPITDVWPLAGLWDLHFLDLSRTAVTDLAPLLEVPGLGWVDLRGIPLDLTPGSTGGEYVAALRQRGVEVLVDGP